VGELHGSDPMQLEDELQCLIDWFNQSRSDPLLRAGICHLWLITPHPFGDGNGRITRASTDMALTQAESQSIRLYALSAAILKT